MDLVQIISQIRQILWADGPDTEWDSGTADEIAAILQGAGLGPPTGAGETKVGKLYRTTTVIWTDYDPSGMEIADLAVEATSGEAYCSFIGTEEVDVPEDDPYWDDNEYFDGNGSH